MALLRSPSYLQGKSMNCKQMKDVNCRSISSPSGLSARGLYVLLLFFSLFLTVHLKPDYLRMYWSDLDQISRIGRSIWVDMITILLNQSQLEG